MTLLQVYNGDPDAVSMLDDLKLCYERFLGKKAERGGDNDEASDAMVEILLSFASKGSQLFRKTSEQVFEAFADQVTATGLQSMIDILEAKDNLAGQQEMFENQEQGDEGDVDMMDVDMDSDDDDVEEISAEEGSSDEEDELKEGEGEEDDAELEAFDAKLAEALGVDQNKEDEGSDDEADMNDDDMEKIDDQIVKVFRARKESSSKKKDKKDAKENMLNFKNRVLDLLHIYVKKCHLNPIALDLLLPLLQLSRRSTVKQIGTRAGTVLRDYTKACKGSNVPMIEAESKDDVLALLKNVHQEATYSGPAAFSSACSQASLLLVKVLVAQDKETISDI
ncbi:DNA-directed DNA polymerase, partial [Ascosphaera atra]